MATRCIIKKDKQKFLGQCGVTTTSINTAKVFYSKKEAREKYPDSKLVEVEITEKDKRVTMYRAEQPEMIIVYHLEFFCCASEDDFYGPYIEMEEADLKLKEVLDATPPHFNYVRIHSFEEEVDNRKVVRYYENKWYQSISLVQTTLWRHK
jgi:hypothetical protein